MSQRIKVYSYSIYHSANSYIGIILAEKSLQGLPVDIERRPIHIPKKRGIKVAELQGRSEGAVLASYHKEDCLRWAKKYGIEIRLKEVEEFARWVKRWEQMKFGREELPARAYYAARGTGKEHLLDAAFFRATYIDLLDVNDESVIRKVANEVGLNGDQILELAYGEAARQAAVAALEEYERFRCPGVPTWVVEGERFWGKDRVDWLTEKVKQLINCDD
ncbi:DsbA family protein [Nostoc sp. CENA67]|uniref:DsbA family protein n=1 Tax=Amazonocrinis nigriterrae CENA67 TaxID=2794033 RepID=A0A8J7HWW9_9NOST|nr:DsbA family protein [Amazonocrinis nigriterrae]MBH8565113.1 DsbA family protein [Amazonocrinis nigriterrae CENA67]